MRRKAFTLIELLVVIAIIAILAAILFPVFAQAREKARQTTCVSNMKQAGLGVLMYVQDYDETYPQSEYGDNGACGPQIQWYGMIQPYIKSGNNWGNGGTFSCPSHVDQRQGQHYGLHYDLFPTNYSCGRNPVYAMASVDRPAEKIFMVEKGRNGQSWGVSYYGTWEWDWTAWVGRRPDGSVTRDGSEIAVSREGDDMSNNNGLWWAQGGMLPRYRHSGTTDCWFGDGHVKSFPKNAIKWYANVFLPVGQPAQWASWGYPY